MTRKEHLEFCTRCINRKLDSRQGLICQLTGRQADFEETCEHFTLDESVTEELPEDEAFVPVTNTDVIDNLPDEIKSALREHQSLYYAMMGGLMMALVTAVLWAGISVLSMMQFGWLAVGIGFAVGLSVRFFGAGIDRVYGVIGGSFALLAILIGNIFFNVGYYAREESLPLFEVLGYLNFPVVAGLLAETFEPIDILFYGLAMYLGYKYSFRTIPDTTSAGIDFSPAGAYLRFPMTLVVALIIGGFMFVVSMSVDIDKENYYPDGELYSRGRLFKGNAEGSWTFYHRNGVVLSTGNFEKDMQTGEWTYYHENGTIMGTGHFENDRQTGEWTWYDEDGTVSAMENHYRGLPHGQFLSFHTNGVLSDSGSFAYGRRTGLWVYRYENGNLREQGEYELDRYTGKRDYYYENGQLKQTGNFKEGDMQGLWTLYTETGAIKEEQYHPDPEITEWINAWDAGGNRMVTDGNGYLRITGDDGTLLSEGSIQNRRMEGTWTHYFPNGSIHSVIGYTAGKPRTHEIRDAEGKLLVRDGEGRYQTFYEESGQLFEEGTYTDGLKNGDWKIWYDRRGSTPLSSVHYRMGVYDGKYTSWYENGNKSVSGQYSDGKYTGQWTWYHENGTISSQASFPEGIKEGDQLFYDEYGMLQKKEIYENGKLVQTVVE